MYVFLNIYLSSSTCHFFSYNFSCKFVTSKFVRQMIKWVKRLRDIFLKQLFLAFIFILLLFLHTYIYKICFKSCAPAEHRLHNYVNAYATAGAWALLQSAIELTMMRIIWLRFKTMMKSNRFAFPKVKTMAKFSGFSHMHNTLHARTASRVRERVCVCHLNQRRVKSWLHNGWLVAVATSVSLIECATRFFWYFRLRMARETVCQSVNQSVRQLESCAVVGAPGQLISHNVLFYCNFLYCACLHCCFALLFMFWCNTMAIFIIGNRGHANTTKKKKNKRNTKIHYNKSCYKRR